MPNSVKEVWGNILTTAALDTGNNVSQPIFLKQMEKRVTVNSTDLYFTYPGSRNFDLLDLTTNWIVTNENGTAGTCNINWQGCIDPLSSSTWVNHTGGYSSSATSIVVNTGDGASIGSGSLAPVVPICLMQFDTKVPGNLKAYEWMICTSVSTDTLTVTRAAFGTTALTISNGDFLFYSNNWVAINDSSGSAINNSAFAHDGATAAAPKIGTLQMSSKGLTDMPYNAFRVYQEASSNGGVTAHVDAVATLSRY